MLCCRQQGGWLLLELLLAWAVGALVVLAAVGFFSVATAKISNMMMACQRVAVMKKWLSWIEDSLDEGLAQQRCSSSDHPSVLQSAQSAKGFVLHSCRWLDQRWQWVDSRYYVRAKKGENYLYEKIAVKPAVAWIPGIDAVQVRALSGAGLKLGFHQLEINLKQSAEYQSMGIKPRLVVSWCDAKA